MAKLVASAVAKVINRVVWCFMIYSLFFLITLTQVSPTCRPLCNRFPPGCPRIFLLFNSSKTEFLVIDLKQQLAKILE